MATLLAGDEAVAAAVRLVRQAPFLTAHVHPSPASAHRSRPVQLLALAHSQGEAVLIDAPRTPALGPLLAAQPRLGGLCGKGLGHALMSTWGHMPERIACAQISHSLLQGDVAQPMDLAALAALYSSGTSVAGESLSALQAFAQQAQQTAQLLQIQAQKIRGLGLAAVSRIESAALCAVVMMERNGMPVDRLRLRACLTQEAHELTALAQELTTLLRTPLTQASDDRALLLALQERGHPLTSLSSAKQSSLPEPLRGKLLRFTELRRLRLTLGERFARHIGDDGRIHSHFIQIGARSGRMACTRPNLQAITADRSRRACFRAPQGYALVMGDYAACELRILAQMSGDGPLRDAIARGTDLHAAIATTMFGQPVSKTVQPHLRQAAKTIAFGLIYGMGITSLAAALQCAPPRASHLMQQFFAAFPKVQHFLQEDSVKAVARGYAVTLSGRRCSLERTGEGASRGHEAALLRMARNLPIQGTSADVTKIALARIHKALAPHPRRALVHCIHDEIVLLCPTEEADEAQEQLRQAMEGAAAPLMAEVPLLADVRQGQEWQSH